MTRPGAMRGARRGMTVLELIVALVVAALAAAMGTASIATLVDQRARLRDAAAETARAAAVRRAVAAWLDGAYVTGAPQEPGFRIVDHVDHGRPDDEVVFPTTARTPLGAGGDAVVRLFIDRDPRTPERGLAAEISDWRDERVARVELDSSVVALDARCLTDITATRQWITGWASSVVLPIGVELRFAAASPERLTPLLRVPVTVRILGGR